MTRLYGIYMNDFIYKQARKECVGKSDDWVKQAIGEILTDLEVQMNADNKAPPSEQLDRIEAVAKALKDELAARDGNNGID